MAAVTRRGLYGGARSPYGSFDKAAGATKTFVKRFTRLGLYAGARPLYGSFVGKVGSVPAPTAVHPPGMGRGYIRKQIIEEDEMILAVIMAFLQIKDE